MGKKPPSWGKKVKREEVEAELWEEEFHRRAWTLGHGFYKPTHGRLGLVCWTCHYEGHRTVDYAINWGLPQDHVELKCTRWCRIRKAPTTKHAPTQQPGKCQWATPKVKGRATQLKRNGVLGMWLGQSFHQEMP